MPPKSAVIRSPNRAKIDRLLEKGESPRFISNWLKSLETPEKISHTAINNYKKNHFNINQEATIKYNEKKSKERLGKASDKVVSDLEYCDNIIDLAHKIDLRVDHKNKITELDIKKLGLQAVKTKQEILQQGEPEDKNVRVEIVVVDSDEDNTMEAQPKTGN
ncbi:MAG: hypothetical protein A4E27_00550 [Methanobacterium sp. PtaU1.Bin242]|nr:MAG: hypothetical protein A4E27_00550 [Methanobacterium sp. PtaU1.Bin242]